MIHLVKFLVKIIAFIIYVPAFYCLIFIAIIMWDKRFVEKTEDVFNLIWRNTDKR